MEERTEEKIRQNPRKGERGRFLAQITGHVRQDQ